MVCYYFSFAFPLAFPCAQRTAVGESPPLPEANPRLLCPCAVIFDGGYTAMVSALAAMPTEETAASGDGSGGCSSAT